MSIELVSVDYFVSIKGQVSHNFEESQIPVQERRMIGGFLTAEGVCIFPAVG